MTPEQITLREKIVKTWPEDLRKEKRWCAWFQGDRRPDGDGYAKIPRGSHSDPNTWYTFADIWRELHPGDGVGYNFFGGDVHPWDLDHVRNANTGLICNEAMLLLSRFSSFTEISVSGRGLHVLTRGDVRGQQLSETCLQYWNPAKAPRFFTVTGELVGPAFGGIRNIGGDGNLVFATAAHISAKCREELQAIDSDQWAKLPAEPIRKTAEPRERSKTKTRKVVDGFDIKDFLQFYGLGIDNETDNELGHCIRLITCPIKGAPHVGQNSTSTNFIFPTTDGGLAFHCNSTGCVEKSVHDALAALAEAQGSYPKPIYEKGKQQAVDASAVRGSRRQPASEIQKEHRVWLWPGYLEANQLIHLAGASAEGKSPITRDLVSRFTSGGTWPDGTVNEVAGKGVLMLSSEDDWSTVIRPHLELAGANLERVYKFISTIIKGDTVTDVMTALDRDVELMRLDIEKNSDIGMVIIDPITNYLGRLSMNKEDEMRGLLMPLADLAQQNKVCVITVGHLNKRGKDATLLQQVMGAAAFAGVARQTIFCSKDPDDESKFSHVMGFGRGTTTPALRYKTNVKQLEWGGQASDIVVIEWGEKCEVDIEEAVTSPMKQREKSQARTVRQLVKAMLTDGQKPSEYVEQALREAGIDAKYNWQREAAKVAKNGKGGPEKKGGEKFYWWLDAGKQMEFDK